MKSQLSAKLAEARTKFRDEAAKEHEEAMQTLQVEHEAAVQQLTAMHEAVLSDLRSQHVKQLEELNKEAVLDAASQQTGDVKPIEASQGTSESTAMTEIDAGDSLTQKQVQTILSTNEFARAILLRNITKRLEQQAVKLNGEHAQALDQQIAEARTKQEEILREEHEKLMLQKIEQLNNEHEQAGQAKLDEATAGFLKSREQAVTLEGKKWGAKISMLDTRSRTAMAKIEVVKKAAEDTPQKPVGEVWEIAKDVKAPPAPSVQPPATTPSSNTSTSTSAAPPPYSTHPLQTPVKTAMQSPNVNIQPPAQTPGQSVAAPAVPNASAGHAAPTKPDNIPKEVPSGPGTSSQFANEGTALAQSGGPLTQPAQITSAMQNGNASARPPQAQQGTGPTTLRGMLAQSSAIPRGGGIPRPGRGGNFNAPQAQQGGLSIRGAAGGGYRGGDGGGGRGRGRGGHHQSPGGSPGDGRHMNAGARQFVPGGNKRPREGSDGGPEGLHGKRSRGGGDGY